MTFDALRFNGVGPATTDDSPKRFTSCCLSLEGNLTLVRVQESTRLAHWRGSPVVRRLDSPFSSLALDPLEGAPSQLHVDLHLEDPRWLHLILWANGSPHMLALLIQDIRGRRGLEAAGWFALQHHLSLQAFIASVRAVREADESLPLLLTAFHARRAAGLSRVEMDWQLLESVAARYGLPNAPPRSDPLSSRAVGKEFNGNGPHVAGTTPAWRSGPRLPAISRLNRRFRFDDV